MGLLKRLKRNRSAPTRPRKAVSKKARPNRSEGPKNGRLALGVVGSMLLLVVLGVLNVRLISDPSVSLKAFGPSVSAESDPDPSPNPCTPMANSEGNSGDVALQSTFWTTLDKQDKPLPTENESDQPATEGRTTDQLPPRDRGPATPPEAAKKKIAGNGWKSPAASNRPSCLPKKRLELPRAKKGKKGYTVQVGSFSHPTIAQRWARQWQAKGYDVALRPVARPGLGVIYRLYLGRFSSEEKADQLVKRLQSKEGIRAFRQVIPR
ncbi:SPOR domain-containing protein [Thermodesulfobacteriota bacterium]